MGQYEGGAFKGLKREVCRDTDIYSQFLLLYIWFKKWGGHQKGLLNLLL